MNQIFICYRRDDTAAVAGRIFDRLSQKFGKSAIFKDVDSIPLGVNFKHHLDSVVKQCDVVLVLVGEKWLDGTKGIEERRINKPRDFVRIEIESALRRDIPVIPLLIENTEMPSEEDLPAELKEFAYRNGMSIRHDPYFHRDIDHLIESLESVFAASVSTKVEPIETRESPTNDTPRPSPNTPPVDDTSGAKEEKDPDTPYVYLPVIENESGGSVLPIAIGLETLGGVFTKLITEGSPLPVRHCEIFSTASDNQTSVEVHVLAGLRSMAVDNVSLGKFHLVGIPPAPRGMPQIEVCFVVDAQGVMAVSAKDMGTGREQMVTIDRLGQSNDDIERLLRDANSHAAEDTRKIEEIQARNRLDNLTHQAENIVNENRKELELAVAFEIESAIVEAKQALKEGGVALMNGAFHRLRAAVAKLPARLAQQPTPSSGSSFREILKDLFGRGDK